MAPDVDLYLDRMDLESYCDGETCELCKVGSFEEYIERIKAGGPPAGPCPHWSEARIAAFRMAVEAGKIIPAVPMLTTPRPADPGLFDFNDPDESAPLLLTGNSELTQAVMFAVVSMTRSPVRLLSIETKGHTVDMAMVFKEMKPGAVAEEVRRAEPAPDARIVLPGLCAQIANEISDVLERRIEVGPVCAAELGLYMGEDWQPLQ